MQVGFVVEPYEESHASGMGYSVLETMKHLPLVAPQHNYTFFSSRPIAAHHLPQGSRNVLIPKSFLKQFLWFLRFPSDVEVLLFVAPLLPFIVPRRVRTILLCKDLASQALGGGSFTENVKIYIRDRVLMPRTVARASAIATPSQATKDDLERVYGVSGEKITVTYEGFQSFNDCPEEPVDTSLAPYFFFAGKVKYRKNIHGIAAGFVHFKRSTQSPCRLVIAGDAGGEYLERIKKILTEGGVQDDVHFVGYVTKGQLRSWFTHSVGVVFPSLAEGFGMPIIEAFSLRVPVITSSISSMAEIAGDAALTVNPYDTKAIGNAMGRLYTDHALRVEMVARGAQRSKLFSWEKVTAGYVELIEKSK